MGCCSDNGGNAGPFAEGKELVEFVYQAHGGGLRNQAVPGGGLTAVCQACRADFKLKSYVDSCPTCGGVHAVSPPRSDSAENNQFSGKNFQITAN